MSMPAGKICFAQKVYLLCWHYAQAQCFCHPIMLAQLVQAYSQDVEVVIKW